MDNYSTTTPSPSTDSSINILEQTLLNSNGTIGSGRIRVSPQVIVGGGIALLVIVLFGGAFIFWFLQFRLRRRQENANEKVKQRARDDYETKKGAGGTPFNRKKVADKSIDKKGEGGKGIIHQGSEEISGEETIAQFENRVREQFSREKVLEEIREEERSPKNDRHETASETGKSVDLERNDSKVNMFKESGSVGEDSDTNNPALGKTINLETI